MCADNISNNFTITHAMRSKFASLGNRLLKGDTRQQRQSIKEILDEEPDLVEPTLLLLQSGLMYDVLGNIQRRLPQSCRKIHLVLVRTMTKFIVSHSPLSMGDLKMLRREAGKTKTNVLEQLFCFATRLDRESPITEHQEDASLSDMEARHLAAGSPLQNIELDGSLVDWGRSGCYLLVNDAGATTAPFSHVLHRSSGEKVALPNGRVIETTEGWKLCENWNERTAILKNGAEALMIFCLFEGTSAWDYTKKVFDVRRAKMDEMAKEAAQAILGGNASDMAIVPAQPMPTPAPKRTPRKRGGLGAFSPAPAKTSRARRAER